MSEVFTTASTTAIVTVGSNLPTSSSIPLPTQPAPFTFPSAFDTSLGTNFTNASCPAFFQEFLADENFVKCYPVSFYLLNSKSYVTVVRQGISSVETVLNASCAADFQQCSSLMSNYSQELTKVSACLNDFNLENPLVTQAFNDFIAYDLVRNATCLRRELNHSNASQVDRDTSYCYTHALFDLDRLDDAYLYLMPLGIPYPNMTVPSCSNCTEVVMNMFWESTGNAKNPISYTYNSAAESIINGSNCSSGFVQASAKPIDTPSSSESAKSAASSINSSIMLILLLFPFILSILMIN